MIYLLNNIIQPLKKLGPLKLKIQSFLVVTTKALCYKGWSLLFRTFQVSYSLFILYLSILGSCVVYEPLDRYVGRHLDRYIGRDIG